MHFPILHIPGLGDGMTIALDAVVHVFISHGLAIGLVSMLVLFQTLSWRGKGLFWGQISRRLLGPAVLITTSLGAVTGVGIWFLTGILAPEGIGSLIHLFFWPWFIEWGTFTAEVIFLLVYYFLWDRLAETKPGLLAALGWGYVSMALVSAILISGILGFMLTPDGWPQGQRFDQAYFNPTFIPQCFLRVAAGLALGSILVLAWTAWRFRGTPDERKRVLRLSGAIFLGAALVTAASAFIYFSRVPQTYLTHWKFAVATSALSQRPAVLPLFNAGAALTAAALALAALLQRTTLCRILSIPALILCLGLVTEFERIREFVRGPYLLPGYMYANQISLVQHQALLAGDGALLPEIRWINDTGNLSPELLAGQSLFAVNCGVCHSTGGINDIRSRLQGRSLDGIIAGIGLTENLAPFMPPFSGSEQERLLMAHYLYKLTNNTLPQGWSAGQAVSEKEKAPQP